jgi:hypothetical protein
MRIALLGLAVTLREYMVAYTTGELLDIERVTSSSERGGWKSVRVDNSLAAYSTGQARFGGRPLEKCRPTSVTRWRPTLPQTWFGGGCDTKLRADLLCLTKVART